MNNEYLRIMYEQYFCNVCDYTDEELSNTHTKFEQALLKNEDTDYNDVEELYNLAIWEPFEDVGAQHVFDNIVEGVKRLEGLS